MQGLLVILLTGIGAGMGGPVRHQNVDDRVKVELLLATEHVPKDLKPGARVDLKVVTGKTVGPKKLTVYSTALVAAGAEIASVTTLDKPANPEAAVRVRLLVARDVAGKVEKARDQLVKVAERQPDGSVVTRTKPVTLRLEPANADKK